MSVVIPTWLENLKDILRTELPEESVESFMADFEISYVEFTDFNEAKNIWLSRVLTEIAAPAATDYKVAAMLDFAVVGLRTDWVIKSSLDWAKTATVEIARHATEIYVSAQIAYNKESVSPDHEKMLSLRHAKATADMYVADVVYTAVNGGDNLDQVILSGALLSGELSPEFSAACFRMAEMLLESLVAST